MSEAADTLDKLIDKLRKNELTCEEFLLKSYQDYFDRDSHEFSLFLADLIAQTHEISSENKNQSEIEDIEKQCKYKIIKYLIRIVSSAKKTEVILGDLEEGYAYDLEKFGPRFAKFNYAKECLGVFGEGVKAWVMRQLPFAQAVSALLGKISGK